MFPYKFLWCLNFLTATKKSDFSLQPGQKEKMKFFSTLGFQTRPIFILTGLWTNRTCSSWGWNLQRTFTKKSSHSEEVTIWVSMKNHHLIGPVVPNKTVNSEQYLHMFQDVFLPQCMAEGLCLPAQCFVQDGAMLQTANVMLDFFNIVFGPHIMSNRYLNHHNCDRFGHFLALIWILLIPFSGVYWKRWSHENLPMKVR